MAKTMFNQNCVWMHLKNEEELELLLQEIEKRDFHGKLLFWEWINDEKLGRRIFVAIKRSIVTKYLYGEEYQKWEKIKNAIYRYRKNNS